MSSVPHAPTGFTDRRSMCDGCAFRPGTEANLSPLTLAKAQLCLMASEPFHCHADDGPDGEPPERGRDLCLGWADAMTAHYRRGFFGPGYEQRLPMYRAGLRAILAVEDRLLAGDSADDIDMPAEVLAALEIEAPS